MLVGLPPGFQHERAVSETEADLAQPHACSARVDSGARVHHDVGTVDEEGAQGYHSQEHGAGCTNHLKKHLVNLTFHTCKA